MTCPPIAWRAAGAFALAATVFWLYTGTRLWVRLNGYTYRYLMPTALMIQAAIMTVGVAPLCRAVRPATRNGLNAMAVAALFAAAELTFGFPSYSGVRADIDRKCGAMTDDLIAARCTHLAGDYFRVWPAVFHARLVLYERGEDRIVWGVTGRGEATAHLCASCRPIRSGWRYRSATPRAQTLLKEFDFPALRELERRSTVRVLGYATLSN